MEYTIPDTYNPNALVTYKKVAGTYAAPEAPEFATEKVVDLEWTLHRLREDRVLLQKHRDIISEIQSHMTRDDWFNPNTEASEILDELCKILDYEPKSSIRITAQIEVEISIELPIGEVEDFDADAWVSDWLSIDTATGDASVDSWACSTADWEDD